MKREIKGYITKETDKYIYTTEIVSYTEDNYFIDFKLPGGRKAWGCTVYKTREAAEREIAYEARLFGHKVEDAEIRWQYYHGQRIVHHRYKKG